MAMNATSSSSVVKNRIDLVIVTSNKPHPNRFFTAAVEWFKFLTFTFCTPKNSIIEAPFRFDFLVMKNL